MSVPQSLALRDALLTLIEAAHASGYSKASYRRVLRVMRAIGAGPEIQAAVLKTLEMDIVPADWAFQHGNPLR